MVLYYGITIGLKITSYNELSIFGIVSIRIVSVIVIKTLIKTYLIVFNIL